MSKIKNYISEMKQTFVSRMKRGEILCSVFISVLVTFFLEILGRRDIFEGISFLWTSPFSFLYNVLIVFLTLCPAFFMKKRFFGFAFIITGWVVLGVTNFVLQTLRIVPLTSIDFANCTINLLVTYIGFIGMFFLVAGIVAALVVFFFIYRKIPTQRKFGSVKATSMIVIVAFSMFTLSFVSSSFQPEQEESLNINEAYEEYGFAYSFARTFIDKGIEKPEHYNPEHINRISRILSCSDDIPEDSPNVIILQLESFFDMKYMNNITLSSDPCPIFTHLKETCPSGFLSVPSVGAGTVNTEFEVLSGMNIDFFGFGEYPYKSVLQTKTCETVASILRSFDYTTTALHNYEGTFYDRYKVYENLGFDRFVPIEFMSGIERNHQGWAKDKVLLPYIIKTLESSEDNDFIFGVTVQSHGSYPIDLSSHYDITISGDLTPELISEYEYYANEISQVDKFIGALVSYLESFDEPTVLVLYGDHMPCLSEFEDSDLSSGNMFTSEYVIWSNYGLSGEDRDLEAFQLSSYLFELLNINNGLIFEYHEVYRNSSIYMTMLEQLEYDILYGNNYSGVTCPKGDMSLGFDDISVESCTVLGDSLYVKGNNFTEYSVIYLNGFAKHTEYISDGVLMTDSFGFSQNSKVEVKQVSENGYKYN